MNGPVSDASARSALSSNESGRSTGSTSGDGSTNSRYACFCQLGDLLGDGDFLRQTRHHIHQNPELSFKEFATSE
ncbi:MAG: amidohydrolase, partial [Ideonella sp.]